LGEVPEQPRRHGPAVVAPHLVGDQAAGEDARDRQHRDGGGDQDGPANVLDTHESSPFTPPNAKGAAKITLPSWSGSTSCGPRPGFRNTGWITTVSSTTNSGTWSWRGTAPSWSSPGRAPARRGLWSTGWRGSSSRDTTPPGSSS